MYQSQEQHTQRIETNYTTLESGFPAFNEVISELGDRLSSHNQAFWYSINSPPNSRIDIDSMQVDCPLIYLNGKHIDISDTSLNFSPEIIQQIFETRQTIDAFKVGLVKDNGALFLVLQRISYHDELVQAGHAPVVASYNWVYQIPVEFAHFLEDNVPEAHKSLYEYIQSEFSEYQMLVSSPEETLNPNQVTFLQNGFNNRFSQEKALLFLTDKFLARQIFGLEDASNLQGEYLKAYESLLNTLSSTEYLSESDEITTYTQQVISVMQDSKQNEYFVIGNNGELTFLGMTEIPDNFSIAQAWQQMQNVLQGNVQIERLSMGGGGLSEVSRKKQEEKKLHFISIMRHDPETGLIITKYGSEASMAPAMLALGILDDMYDQNTASAQDYPTLGEPTLQQHPFPTSLTWSTLRASGLTRRRKKLSSNDLTPDIASSQIQVFVLPRPKEHQRSQAFQEQEDSPTYFERSHHPPKPPPSPLQVTLPQPHIVEHKNGDRIVKPVQQYTHQVKAGIIDTTQQVQSKKQSRQVSTSITKSNTNRVKNQTTTKDSSQIVEKTQANTKDVDRDAHTNTSLTHRRRRKQDSTQKNAHPSNSNPQQRNQREFKEPSNSLENVNGKVAASEKPFAYRKRSSRHNPTSKRKKTSHRTKNRNPISNNRSQIVNNQQDRVAWMGAVRARRSRPQYLRASIKHTNSIPSYLTPLQQETLESIAHMVTITPSGVFLNVDTPLVVIEMIENIGIPILAEA